MPRRYLSPTWPAVPPMAPTSATCNENLKGIIQTGNDPVGALIDGGIAEFLAVLGGEADRPEVVQIPAHDGHHV